MKVILDHTYNPLSSQSWPFTKKCCSLALTRQRMVNLCKSTAVPVVITGKMGYKT